MRYCCWVVTGTRTVDGATVFLVVVVLGLCVVSECFTLIFVEWGILVKFVGLLIKFLNEDVSLEIDWPVIFRIGDTVVPATNCVIGTTEVLILSVVGKGESCDCVIVTGLVESTAVIVPVVGAPSASFVSDFCTKPIVYLYALN